MSVFIPIEDALRRPHPPAPAPGFALWQLGFRPFYLLASSFGALSIGLWALQVAGWLGRPYLQGPLWHAHEMLFGFALAVIVGFLLTAGRNWADRPTLSGAPLAALALLWLAARVLVLTPYGAAAAAANVAFPLAAALALAVPFVAAGNRRNYFFVGLLLLLAAAAAWVHLGSSACWRCRRWPACNWRWSAALHHGRDGRPGLADVHQQRRARRPRHAPAAAGKGGAGFGARAAGRGCIAACRPAAGRHCRRRRGAHLARWLLWQPWTTWRVPIVWVLHAAYLWIPVHLALRAGAALDWTTPSLATHALTAGAAGGLIIGMMTRTARGHTARPLRADRVDVACYVLVWAPG